MIAKAVRLHGKDKIQLDSLNLPEPGNEELLVKVVSDSICMSSYKAMCEGENHKRVPTRLEENPIILGHEFCGEILEVGKKWKDQFKIGQKFSIQPIINYKGNPEAPGYSYPFIGGAATYGIVPKEVLEQNCLLLHNFSSYYMGSLAEPYCCVIGAFDRNYHLDPQTNFPKPGIRPYGKMLFLAGTGPMGSAALDYAIHMKNPPSQIIITSRNNQKLMRMKKFFQNKTTGKTQLNFVETTEGFDYQKLLALTENNVSFDDIFVFAPDKKLIEDGDKLLASDGCLNFFAGPRDSNFSASLNLFNLHYHNTHYVGSSGGSAKNMAQALEMLGQNKLHPEFLISHIGGLNCVVDSLKNLPEIGGGKKLIYTQINLPLIALNELKNNEKKFPFLGELGRMVDENQGLWSPQAESYLLAHAPAI